MNEKTQISLFICLAFMTILTVIYMDHGPSMSRDFLTLRSAQSHRMTHENQSDEKIYLYSLDIKMREAIMQEQAKERNRIYNQGSILDIVYAAIPEVFCSTMIRLGTLSDGGKWICNPWRLRENCVLFSFGINKEVTFEMALARLTNERCRMYGFDVKSFSGRYFSLLPHSNFSQVFISNETLPEANAYTISDLMLTYDHRVVDVLKVDLEGHEFHVMHDVLSQVRQRKLQICQILIEVHGNKAKTWRQLLINFRNAGYELFAKEYNPLCRISFCTEYSFVHKNCESELGITF